MKLRCINHSNGCSEVVEYPNLKKHEMSCSFAKIKCPSYKDCKVEGFRGDIEEHKRTCQYIKVSC